MSKKMLTLSIVIPVFNEQDYLAACLDSIAAQTVQPDEVIVVDNNSTDQTVAIAQNYPFVKIIRESRQGSIFAQKKGFEASTGRLIGRIDADTRLEKNWVKNALDYFQTHSEVAAITGWAFFYDFPFKKISSAVHAFIYHVTQKRISGGEILWGANMVIARRAWRLVKNRCQNIVGINEDIDLSLHLREVGLVVIRTPVIKASVSMRRGELGALSSIGYLSSWHRTYWQNGYRFQAALVYLLKVIVLIMGIPFFVQHAVLQLRPRKPAKETLARRSTFLKY